MLSMNQSLTADYEIHDSTEKSEQTMSMDEFLRSVQKPAYRMAKLSTLNNDDALDLVQDAMAKLFEKYSDKPTAELKPLFYTILSSKLKDWHRKRAFRQQFHVLLGKPDEEGNPIELLANDFAQTQEDWLSDKRQMSEVLLALSQLSEKQRQVILFRSWQGFSVADTAQIMNCSEGSVKTHLHRANQALQNHLGADYVSNQ